jgi:hypothetical protein
MDDRCERASKLCGGCHAAADVCRGENGPSTSSIRHGRIISLAITSQKAFNPFSATPSNFAIPRHEPCSRQSKNCPRIASRRRSGGFRFDDGAVGRNRTAGVTSTAADTWIVHDTRRRRSSRLFPGARSGGGTNPSADRRPIAHDPAA